jgi:hypothetical protein
MKTRVASTRVADLAYNPKGIGGSQTRYIQATKGKFGPASKARRLTAEEKAAVEDQMRRDGQLS